MKTRTVFLASFLLIVVLFITGQDLLAQGCVQCRMVPASDLNNGGKAAGNVNSAILYLMAVPYLLLVSIAVYVFRKKLKDKWEQFRGSVAH